MYADIGVIVETPARGRPQPLVRLDTNCWSITFCSEWEPCWWNGFPLTLRGRSLPLQDKPFFFSFRCAARTCRPNLRANKRVNPTPSEDGGSSWMWQQENTERGSVLEGFFFFLSLLVCSLTSSHSVNPDAFSFRNQTRCRSVPSRTASNSSWSSGRWFTALPAPQDLLVVRPKEANVLISEIYGKAAFSLSAPHALNAKIFHFFFPIHLFSCVGPVYSKANMPWVTGRHASTDVGKNTEFLNAFMSFWM